MNPGWLDWLTGPWRRRRERRNAAALGWIKARYHIFRVLLAHNERALELLAAADRLLGDNEPARLGQTVRELREIVLELADGLNRLTGNGHDGLYPRLAALEARLETALERLGRTPRRLWLPLADITPDQREQAGGKAQPLGTLLRAGLPVPDGVSLTRRACREYLRQAGLEDRLKAILRQAAARDADHAALAETAQAMIAASTPSPALARELRAAWDFLADGGPLAVSVRSSASSEDGVEHSFAGQYSSVLGVRSFEGFVQAFITVLASAFSARALAYRARAGLARESVDMAVLVQKMVAARAAGVLYSVDPMAPENGRMLLTAVPGLGSLAVSGRAPADVFRPGRGREAEDVAAAPAEIAAKTVREVLAKDGGTRLESVPEAERLVPLLVPDEIAALRDHALRIEALAGCPQDIEWAIDQEGQMYILQARPAKLARPLPPEPPSAGAGGVPGQVLLAGGAGVSPGKAAGRLCVARSRQELAAAAAAPRPVVLALHQSLVDAASLVPETAALLVDMGNPLDHLASVARELGIPMIIGLGAATTALSPGDWVLADADRGLVRAADPLVWRDAPKPSPRRAPGGDDAAAAVRELLLPLNLTDAYGPTFSILECRSLHDLVRYTHEKAVIALFEAGDAIAEETFSLVRRLRDDQGLSFLIIDLGGGVAPGSGGVIGQEAVLCEPLLALLEGMATPNLRWGKAPPLGSVAGLVSRSMLDARGERPVGNPNYALAARDYLNINARVDYHFAMIDAVCGANPRENSLRFRFKGGGTARIQRERRAVFVETVMREEEFFTTRQGDMVTAVLAEGSRDLIRDKLVMLGRFLGFSRLLDAMMLDDAMPGRLARAFLAGDYALAALDQPDASPR
ncbi:MAG: phosphoenolpyruvate synthase/pyruvate phosphate dikinase [Solidesulfovibrio magneticus str. Maddingley MBC34]|uniref:Phosphoenolpyruvate synthase n=1 Tax=Solidesulfovibrio magneticus str. Maddingley MBC34 TaxID=1206767 RepID=K6GS95_9BACT|nr:MAG: phosphoenolpyruvate synthase/pyruvate phosphate dikinase [Solidesulfovibrio magneticus str. Maddingley MBC34]